MNMELNSPITRKHITEAIIEKIELPNSAYEKAKLRYEDIGIWMDSPEKSGLSQYLPLVAPQGSFRLGTAIKPLSGEQYDLDITVSLKSGLSHSSITQQKLQLMLHTDLEAYRQFRSISEPIESKRRCSRLNYQDAISFHIDVVPSIPANETTKGFVKTMLLDSSATPHLAQKVSNFAVSITDNERLPQYNNLTNDWLLSNPEGYALWFEEQSKKAKLLFERKVFNDGVMANVSELPNFKWKSPLQQCVQILKHHRDVMFSKKNAEGKPISIIITTLAARAYDGETNLATALKNILTKMAMYINDNEPRVPNPVNLEEDFADKWSTVEGEKLELEENFRTWLKKAKSDFFQIENFTEVNQLDEHVKTSLEITLSADIHDDQIINNKLLSKATLASSGVIATSPQGVLGSEGIANKKHKFYGDSST